MTIPSNVLEFAGLPDPDAPAASSSVEEESQQPESDISSLSAAEERLEQVLGNSESSTQQPNPEQPTQAPVQPEQTPVQPIPEEGIQPPVVDPTAQFAESSKTAFYDEAGQVNTEKVADFFLSKGKSFLKYDTNPAQSEIVEKDERQDPKAEFAENIQNVMSNLPALFKQDKDAGFTSEETMQRLQNTIDGFAADRDKKISVAEEIANVRSELGTELGTVRQHKIDAAVDRNYADLSHTVDGLIDGMKATDILDNIVLNKEFGGEMLIRQFNRDNPGFSKLSKEDQTATETKWMKDFQADKGRFAEVAEYGKMKFLIAQMPDMLQKAQEMGATKRVMTAEGTGQGVSGLQSPQSSQPTSSVVGKFFGMDTVN